MRKLVLFIGIFILTSIITNAQITVITDDSTYTPTSVNAIFEVHASNGNKGILIPRLTTAQRTAIATSGATDQSLMVFDTDTKTFWFFDGTAWVEMATGGTVTDNQNIDSLTLNGLILGTYIENGNPAFVDLTAVSDSAINYIINNPDTLFSNSSFNDSITYIIYNQGDTLLYNQTFISALQDSIDTDIDNADLTGNTLNIYENGNTVSVDLSSLVNDADSDPTNEIELPATAVNGQVLTWNGTDWVAQNSASGADNWGSQVVQIDATLTGDGTSSTPLSVNGDLTDDQNIQNLALSGTTLTVGIEDGNPATVDLSSLQDGTGTDDQNLTLSGNTLSIEDGNSVNLSSFMDNTDDQNLSISGHTLSIESGNSVTLPDNDNQTLSFNSSTNYLSISNGNSVDLSSLAGGSSSGWELTGNAGTTSSNFIGTTDNVDLHFRINNTASGFLSQNNTAFGYQSGNSITSNAINNAFFGDNAGYSDTEGDENVFVGHRVGYYMQKGNSNTAIGYNAFYNYGASGGGPRDGGNKNVAIGKWAMFNPYQGDGNVAVGFDAFSLPNSGEYNVFIGYNSDRDNNNNLNNAIAIGAYSVADADNATAIGYRAYASQANSLILGQTTNDGNQNSATANTNVGINTITPETVANLTLGAMDGSNEGGQITWLAPGSYSTWRTDLYQNQFRLFSNSSNVTLVNMFNYGSGSTDLEIDGTAYKPGGGSWVASSDIRSKENIKNYKKGLNELLKLRPVTYNYKKEFNWGSKTYAGLIAQEVEKVVPTMIVEMGEVNGIKDFKAVDPSELTYMLINAVKELKAENELLKKQNEAIIEKITKLEQTSK